MSSLSATVSFGAAFMAGILTFFTPCVLPLIPAWLTLVTGLGGDQLLREAGETGGRFRWSDSRRVFWPTVFFVLGFSLVFMSMGAALGALGQALSGYDWLLRGLGGVVLAVLGLYLLGVISPAFLNVDTRVHPRRKPFGLLGSAVVGMAFAAGWTPCVGPALAAILTLAALQEGFSHGFRLLCVFSLGLGLPFLIIALLWGQALALLGRARGLMAVVNRVLGALALILAVLVVFGG